MPREIVLGNQCMLVNIDKWLQIRDLFFPRVGEENHIQGRAHKIGVFTNNKISWVNEDAWHRDINYDKDTLVSHSTAENKDLQVSLHMHDVVAHDKNIYLKKISIKNLANWEREIKLFIYHDYNLYGTDFGDTVGYDAHRNAIFQYKRNRYMFMNAINDTTCSSCQPKGDISDFAVGQAKFGNAEGTWRDAEDGVLSKNPIAQGTVDSTIGLYYKMKPGEEKVLYYWIAAGHTRDEVLDLNEQMMTHHPEKIFDETKNYWMNVVNSRGRDFKDLSEDVKSLYKRSALIIITQIDKEGAITAANDSDNMKFNRDTYSYCWPRDGALVAAAMDRAGFSDYVKPFFEFCSRVISKHGCLLHKYNPNGSIGSTWHPWVKNGKPHIPIQEDETALVIWALWKHYEKTHDEEFARQMFEKLVIPAGDFMVRNRYDNGLPIECYDLWEEREGILTFTLSTIVAGLRAAAKFCEMFDNHEKKEVYEKTAEEIKKGMLKHLWDKEKGIFLRMINYDGKKFEKESIVESSTYAVFDFGVLEPTNPKVVSNMKAIKKELWVDTSIGGIARNSNDYYHKVSNEFPGNAWLITTMWLGKWYIAKAKSIDDLQEGKEIIDWVCHRATSSGMLAEQVHPYSGEPMSVSPLTWSHATFLDIVNAYIEKYEELNN